MLANKKFRQMLLENPSARQKQLSFARDKGLLKKRKEVETGDVLKNLEKRYPKGFSYKSKGGNYIYSPRQVSESKAYYSGPERYFSPRNEKKVLSN
jgi:hypothetical protein